MKSQSVNQEITKWYSLLTPVQKESVLTLIKSFLKTDKPVTRKQYNKEIAAAEKRVQKGNFVSHENLESASENW